jgi:hypothetical protein
MGKSWEGGAMGEELGRRSWKGEEQGKKEQ